MKLEDRDYSGLIAVILITAWITFLALGKFQEASAVGPIAASAATYWLTKRRRR